MKKFKKILSFLLTLITFFSITITNVSASTVYGNTNSNIKNGGIAVKYDNYYYNISSYSNDIYSYDYYDDSAPGWIIHSYNIYKKKSESGTIIKTIVKNALQTPLLNSKNGYIYYLGMSTSTGEPGVYRIKTNGTNMKRLASINLITYRGSPSEFLPMIIKDNYIYYCPDHFSIGRMSLNGTNKKIIYKSPTWISSFSISGSYIYVNNITNASHLPNTKSSIYRVNISGSNKKHIYSSNNSISDALYYNGYIFYTYYNHNSNYTYLYRMQSNGKNKKCLLKTKNYINYSIYNDKIYYTFNKDIYNESEDTCLRTCNLNGSNKDVLFKGTHFYIQAITGKVVYVNTLKGIGTYNINTKKVYFPGM